MGEWIEKEQRGKMDAGRMAKRYVSIEEMGNCFLSFFFSLLHIPLYVGGWGGGGLLIKRERRDFG